MYDVTISNHFIMPIEVNASQPYTIAVDGHYSTHNQGNMILDVPGMGQASLIDLGKEKIPGYPTPTETWGMLLRFKGKEIYYRYEGQGQLNLTFDRLGTLNVEITQGSAMIISLPDLQLNGH